MRKIVVDKVLIAIVLEFIASILGMTSATIGAAACLAEKPLEMSFWASLSMIGFAFVGICLMIAGYYLRRSV